MLKERRIHEVHDVKSTCWRWLNEPLTMVPPWLLIRVKKPSREFDVDMANVSVGSRDPRAHPGVGM